MPNKTAPPPDVTHAAASRRITDTHTVTGSDSYLRCRDLPRLIPLWPSELQITTNGDHLRLLARLRRALRIERQRGRAGHFAYDIARHAQLLRAYRAETAQYLAARSTVASSKDVEA